jgi:hypothetical protein
VRRRLLDLVHLAFSAVLVQVVFSRTTLGTAPGFAATGWLPGGVFFWWAFTQGGDGLCTQQRAPPPAGMAKVTDIALARASAHAQGHAPGLDDALR